MSDLITGGGLAHDFYTSGSASGGGGGVPQGGTPHWTGLTTSIPYYWAPVLEDLLPLLTVDQLYVGMADADASTFDAISGAQLTLNNTTPVNAIAQSNVNLRHHGLYCYSDLFTQQWIDFPNPTVDPTQGFVLLFLSWHAWNVASPASFWLRDTVSGDQVFPYFNGGTGVMTLRVITGGNTTDQPLVIGQLTNQSVFCMGMLVEPASAGSQTNWNLIQKKRRTDRALIQTASLPMPAGFDRASFFYPADPNLTSWDAGALGLWLLAQYDTNRLAETRNALVAAVTALADMYAVQ